MRTQLFQARFIHAWAQFTGDVEATVPETPRAQTRKWAAAYNIQQSGAIVDGYRKNEGASSENSLTLAPEG